MALDPKVHPSGWQKIDVGPVPVVILVRDGAAIPRIARAQSTQDLDQSKLELAVFAASSPRATGRLYRSREPGPPALVAEKSGGTFALKSNPVPAVTWRS